MDIIMKSTPKACNQIIIKELKIDIRKAMTKLTNGMSIFNFHFSVAGMHYVSATQPGLWTCHDFQRDRLTPLPVHSRRKRKWWPRINFLGGNGNGLNAGFRYRPGWRPGLLVWYGVSKLNSDATMISSKMNMMISKKKRLPYSSSYYYRVYRVDRTEANWAQKIEISPFERGRARPGIGSQIDPSF